MKKGIGFICIYLAMSTVAFADATDDLQAKLQALKSMSAHFSQTVTSGHRRLSTSNGTMALMRPGRFRWQTNSPMQQLVVANGAKIWVYDPELEQVSVKRQAQEVGGTAGVFLSGEHHLRRDFEVNEVARGVYDLKANSSKESIQHLKLSFVNNTLTAIELFDQLGQRTNIRLSKIKTNITLPGSLFQFKVPKGVDVVQQ